jgi:hypothetical protein
MNTVMDFVELPVHGGFKTKVDPDIALMLSGIRLSIKTSSIPYVRFHKNTREVLLSHFVINAQNGIIVDHINGDTFDNRKSNLRIASKSLNAFNRHNRVISNTGFRGVRAINNRYHARVRHNYKLIYLGSFKNLILAALSRDSYLHRLFNKNCGLNFIESISSDSVRNLLDSSKGKIFKCWFVKRSDGSVRSILCRTGVHKNLKNKGMAYKPDEKNLFLVYDLTNRNYRFIPLENILCLKFKKVGYRVVRERLNAAA